MRDPRVIRELLGLFLLVIGLLTMLGCIVWLFLIDLAPVGFLALGAFAFAIGARLTYREVELPEVPERWRREAEQADQE